MKKKIKLFNLIFFLSVFLFANSKAELTNKIVMTVGNEIITDFDMDREAKYLNAITLGQFKNFGENESKEIIIDSLVKDKIKINELKNHAYVSVSNEMIEDQIYISAIKYGFVEIEDFKKYLEIENYTFDEFKEKIILELKWNQLIYNFYKKQILIDKTKLDQELKTIISKRKKKERYLISEIYIENKNINNNNKEEILNEEKIKKEEKSVKEQDKLIISYEKISYDNEKNIVKSEKILEEPKLKEEKKEENKQISLEELEKNIKEIGFKETAIKFSTSASSENGGNLGWVKENEVSGMMLQYIKNLEIGQTTDPIVGAEGILILKLEDKETEEDNFDIKGKMKELVTIEKNKQLTQFSLNYFNQIKNNVKIKHFDD